MSCDDCLENKHEDYQKRSVLYCVLYKHELIHMISYYSSIMTCCLPVWDFVGFFCMFSVVLTGVSFLWYSFFVSIFHGLCEFIY